MDKYVVLYMGSDGVRHIAEIPKLTDRVELIGITRYTKFDEGSRPAKAREYEQNGSYPVIPGDIFNSLYGKVLTVVDAAFPAGDQKDAFKTLIKNELTGWYSKQTDYAAMMTQQLVDLH